MKDLILRHYAAKPVSGVESRQQRSTADDKPLGFWVSVDSCKDNWPEWCRAESFRLDALEHAHDVHLDPHASILHMASAFEIDAFTREFADEKHWSRTRHIRWDAVAERWQGIIITPYVWSRRLDGDAGWYYGWDCASGCIWDAAAISAITKAANSPSERP